MKLIPITTETIIPMGRFKTVFSDIRAIIRVHDEAGGPFLSIEGQNDEPEDGYNDHQLFLQSETEIDQFAAICKAVLKQAEDAAQGANE